MTEPGSGLIGLKAELMPAVRCDLERNLRRRKLARIAAITIGALLALTGSAFAAGSALGIIDLGGGATATQVSNLPVPSGTMGGFHNGTAAGDYIYELGGVGAEGVVCGPDDPDVATFVTSTQPLSQADLASLLDPSNPIGLNPQVNRSALDITSERGGCFPASLAGPLGSPQTSAEKAAAQAFTQAVTNQAATQHAVNAGRAVHASRLQTVTLIHDGRRAILRLTPTHAANRSPRARQR